MRHIKIAGYNNHIKAPKQWKNQKPPIADLYARGARRISDGLPTLTAAYLPTPEELKLLNAGHPVLVTFLTQQMPPPTLVMVGNLNDCPTAPGLPGPRLDQLRANDLLLPKGLKPMEPADMIAKLKAEAAAANDADLVKEQTKEDPLADDTRNEGRESALGARALSDIPGRLPVGNGSSSDSDPTKGDV